VLSREVDSNKDEEPYLLEHNTARNCVAETVELMGGNEFAAVMKIL
jgi:hypothetical protein